MNASPQQSSPPSPPTEIPESFFLEARADSVSAKMEIARPRGSWTPPKAQLWYDSIIDWMFANPGGKIKACAQALDKSPVTIGLIVRSDLFRARYAQRRARFSEELDHRLVGKLARVAELGLDSIAEALEKKRDQVPLPILNDITSRAMDRLGYGSRAESAGASVHVQVNNQSVEVVSASALEKARSHLRTLEQAKLVEGRSEALPLAGPRVEEL